jgi:two-component system sensor histidine kinase PilS (NtrC family)
VRNLHVVDAASPELLVARPWLFVHGIRTAFLICILLVSIVYQVQLGNFINTEIWLPVYMVLLTNFLFNSIYLFFFDKFSHQEVWNGFLFSMDVVAVTLLIYFTGANQSLFLFLYLVNLILAGLVFSREASWLLVIWSSICFSTLLIVSPEVSGQNLYFSLGVNNLAFVAVTYLSGQLSSQLNIMGDRLTEARSDLQALQNLNDLVVNNIANGLVVVSRTGFVQYFNQAASAMLKADHFQQMKIQEIVPELEWPWESLTESGDKSHERREIKIRREGDEVEKVLEIIAAPLDESDGKLRGWLLLFDDRTDVKNLESTLRQQEKLAAVGQLAAGIAHEIRNPLASISGSIQMLIANPQNHREEDIKLMNIVIREIDRLNNLIAEFLDYVRPEKMAPLPVNLNTLVTEVLESVRFNSKLRQDVRQEIHLNARSDILGNRDKLKQALINLIINSYQAMEKTSQPVIEVETQDEATHVVLIIRDNGCGIKPENLHRIFEPFHTTKAQGTGLGLAVTHKILQAHGAKVLVDSELGKGTKFLIEFPSSRDAHTEDLNRLRRATSA